MPGFERLWENGPLFAQAEHFRLSTDCVLLADFVNTAGAVRGIDPRLRFRGDRAAAARTYG